jgi:hypothetical protein|tara:strand:- start:3460 stop:3909 length:450 start_codon:yes stop_codon:yes gene_type:complete
MRDTSFLSTYRDFLNSERITLIDNQFNSFAQDNELTPNKKLKASFSILVDVLDNQFDVNRVMDSNFLFEVLTSLPQSKERELKKIINNFCSFIETVGVGNTRNHRTVREMYVISIRESVNSIKVEDNLRKSPEFKTEWVARLKEHLNTK